MALSDFLKRDAYWIRGFLKLVLMSGLKLPYALALQLIKMPFDFTGLQRCVRTAGF